MPSEVALIVSESTRSRDRSSEGFPLAVDSRPTALSFSEFLELEGLLFLRGPWLSTVPSPVTPISVACSSEVGILYTLLATRLGPSTFRDCKQSTSSCFDILARLPPPLNIVPFRGASAVLPHH